MNYKLFRVFVFEHDTGEIIHSRSTFADRGRAIDRAWAWYHRGYSVRVVNRASNKIECQMLNPMDGVSKHVNETD